MNLPELANWSTTRDSLHRAAQVVGEIRRLLVPAMPNALHLSLNVAPEGVSSGPLPGGDVVTLDFAKARVVYHGADGSETSVALEGQTPVSLLNAVAGVMLTDADLPGGSRIEDDTTPFDVDTAQAADYARALYGLYTGMARFRAGLSGTMTPLVVWPHHFDLSMLWFAGHVPDEHKEAHINYGFAPFSEGFERPYIYVYAWPMPDNATSTAPPAPARWHTEGFTGIVIDYDDLRAEAAEGRLEALLAAIHGLLAPLL
jgi:hypothetical protein